MYFKKERGQDIVLVLRRIHRAAKRVARPPDRRENVVLPKGGHAGTPLGIRLCSAARMARVTVSRPRNDLRSASFEAAVRSSSKESANSAIRSCDCIGGSGTRVFSRASLGSRARALPCLPPENAACVAGSSKKGREIARAHLLAGPAAPNRGRARRTPQPLNAGRRANIGRDPRRADD